MVNGELILKANVFFRKGYGRLSKMFGVRNGAAKDLISSRKVMKEAADIDLIRTVRRECPTSVWSTVGEEIRGNGWTNDGKNGFTQIYEALMQDNLQVKNVSELLAQGKCNPNQTVASFVKGLMW